MDTADYFGSATVCISMPGGGWSWNASIINDTLSRDCSKESAGQDYMYFGEGLDFIATLPFYAPPQMSAPMALVRFTDPKIECCSNCYYCCSI